MYGALNDSFSLDQETSSFLGDRRVLFHQVEDTHGFNPTLNKECSPGMAIMN
jgi:hypothetical protein